jgi:hypothetical protein
MKVGIPPSPLNLFQKYLFHKILIPTMGHFPAKSRGHMARQEEILSRLSAV